MALGIETKICSSCKGALPLGAFSKAANYKDGYRGQCRPCRAAYSASYKTRTGYKDPNPGRPRKKSPEVSAQSRDAKLRRKYGISAAQFDEMLSKQGGCALCTSSTPRGGRHNSFVVDHCHDTGRVRGILCHPCNISLGVLGDSAEKMARVLTYLTPPMAEVSVNG